MPMLSHGNGWESSGKRSSSRLLVAILVQGSVGLGRVLKIFLEGGSGLLVPGGGGPKTTALGRIEAQEEEETWANMLLAQNQAHLLLALGIV